MRSLLLKEWELQKVTFAAVYTIMLLAAVVVLSTFGPLSPALFAVPFVWLALVSMNFMELKNDSDVLINSLPVTRRQVVLSKYVTLLLFSLGSAGAMAVIHIVLQGLSVVQFVPESPVAAIMLTYTGIGLFLSVYMPLFFVSGPQIMLISSFALFIVGFAVVTSFPAEVTELFLGLLNLWQQYTVLQWSVLLFSGTTLLILLSWLLSVRIYERKNF